MLLALACEQGQNFDGDLAPHGAMLGRVTADGGLVLDPTVERYAVYMDTGRAVITCPRCGQAREFRGGALFSSPGNPNMRW